MLQIRENVTKNVTKKVTNNIQIKAFFIFYILFALTSFLNISDAVLNKNVQKTVENPYALKIVLSSKEDINRERTTETKANVGEPKLYSLQGSSNYLLKIPPEDVKALTDKFIATEQDVREKGEDLYAWLMTNGTKRDNYKFFLIINI